MRYFSGFGGTAGVLAVTASERKIFVDFRYVEQATQSAPAFQIERSTGNPLDAALEWLEKAACEKIGFEEDFLTVAEFTRMTAKVAREKWIPIQLDDQRAVKTPEEIEKIGAAAAIADEALQKVLPMLRPGRVKVTLRQPWNMKCAAVVRNVWLLPPLSLPAALGVAAWRCLRPADCPGGFCCDRLRRRV